MRKAVFLVSAITIIFSGFGCGKLKRIFKGPPSGEIISSSYTVRLMGYQQTVSINATPEELSEFLDNPDKSSSIMLSGLAIEGSEEAVKEDREPTRAGTSFPITVKLMGFEIQGQLIVIKVVESELLWIIWNNPYILQIQRWDSEPVSEGTRLSFKFDTEIPSEGMLGNMVDALGFMGLADAALNEVDMMLAAIQCYFDESLDPKELTSKGLRGETYDQILQAHEAQTWVNATPEEVEAWLIDPENASVFLKELEIDEEYVKGFLTAPPGEVVSSEAGVHFGAIRTKTDLMGVKMKKGKELVMRLYFTLFGRVVLIEVQARPEAGGTLITSRLVFEIPTSVAGEGMEILLFATGIPRMMRERVLMIKQGIEGVG